MENPYGNRSLTCTFHINLYSQICFCIEGHGYPLIVHRDYCDGKLVMDGWTFDSLLLAEYEELLNDQELAQLEGYKREIRHVYRKGATMVCRERFEHFLVREQLKYWVEYFASRGAAQTLNMEKSGQDTDILKDGCHRHLITERVPRLDGERHRVINIWYRTEPVRPSISVLDESKFFEGLTRTLGELDRRRGESYETSAPVQNIQPANAVSDLRPSRTINTLRPQDKAVRCDPNRSQWEESSLTPIHSVSELPELIAQQESIEGAAQIKGISSETWILFEMLIYPVPIATFQNLAYSDGGVHNAHKLTSELNPMLTAESWFSSAGTSNHWCPSDLEAFSSLTNLTMSEASTAGAGQSLPSRTAAFIELQNSNLKKPELRKRDLFDHGDVFEIILSDASKTTSTVQQVVTVHISVTITIQDKSRIGLEHNEIPVSSTTPTSSHLSQSLRKNSDLEKRKFPGGMKHVEIKTPEASKATTAIHQSPISSVIPTIKPLVQANNAKSKGHKHRPNDYWDWFKRVHESREKYLFQERQTRREAYNLQRPGGRTLKQARLRDYSPFRWVLERKKSSGTRPKNVNCIDDMTKAPGLRNSHCDASQLHSTRPQIPAGSTISPPTGPFAIGIVILIVLVLIIPLFKCRDPPTEDSVPLREVSSDTDDDPDGNYPYSDDEDELVQSQLPIWSTPRPRYQSREIDDQLRHLGVQIPDYDSCYLDDREYWEGGDRWA